MTADQFVGSVQDFDTLSTGVQTDLLSYYLLNHGGATSVTAAMVSSLREALHLAPLNRMSAYLSERTKGKGGERRRYVKVKAGYVLERAYSKALEANHLGRPISKNLAASLRGTLTATSDPTVKSYLDEAISCFEFNLLRSALILSWCVAYGLVRSWLFRNHLAALNAAMSTWKAPFRIAKLDDFQDLTEATVLDTARKAALISKEHHKMLKQLLDQRNSFAHPTAKVITPSICEAYIETVVRDVIPYFG